MKFDYLVADGIEWADLPHDEMGQFCLFYMRLLELAKRYEVACLNNPPRYEIGGYLFLLSPRKVEVWTSDKERSYRIADIVVIVT